VTGAVRVGVVAHPDRPEAQALQEYTLEWCASHGMVGRIADDDVADGDLDALISFGGDGTMLRAVDLAVDGGIPVLGVNCGQMGYLTGIEPAQLDDALERLRTGAFEVSERSVVAAEVTASGPAAGSWTALNEIVLEKPSPGHLARFSVAINGAPFTTYAADAMIVATPTGSTAYSFSAGGPIVSPRLSGLLLTPVSPHMLFDRTLVLDDRDELELTVVDRPATLTLDGRDLGGLAPGDRVRARVGAHAARIITVAPRDFHQILKAKFGLSDR
jgi:NAD+ kinase